MRRDGTERPCFAWVGEVPRLGPALSNPATDGYSAVADAGPRQDSDKHGRGTGGGPADRVTAVRDWLQREKNQPRPHKNVSVFPFLLPPHEGLGGPSPLLRTADVPQEPSVPRASVESAGTQPTAPIRH
ncbi:hypothetical protein SKAU_G00274750 [Synaphobranchus kaupii]|uniref:Uncharacterized protein n=1 Tax=Synaphobranchus kaupii TaxID=118154 RepID=A0A9Q1IQY3_SYNKA|nr:hypothetical protein SKAU_G00274750 [Synaphobranchus kaupii]